MLLEVLYQDQWLIVIDKPAGMLVHPGREPEPADQIAMKVLRDQIGHRVQTVHRLDRPTSGVLLFALDEKIEADLRRQFEQQEVGKLYRAVVPGETPERWVSSDPLQKDPEEPFREASTEFVRSEVIKAHEETFSLLEVTPKTGRYHQIRKHLSERGFPIVGDYLYGDVKKMDQLAALTGQSRLMLHAAELTFFHPVEGIEISIGSVLPKRFSPFVRAEG